ncbi:MAG TPA: imidazolonepropionase [Candidatus Limnocylindrales bacterium]|nr:imidazolonepropionase [Candidatus Limnocylindrales bacterium]
MSAAGSSALLVVGAAEVVTMAGGLRGGASQDEPAILSADGPAVAIQGQRLVAVGGEEAVRARLDELGLGGPGLEVLDARGGTVTPGLIDPHTHLLFAGTREAELRLRQRGAGYLEILAAGGGILSTVERTRAASVDELLAHGRRWLGAMLGHGVTTVEAKSGYGLERATELRLLEVAGQLDAEGPVEVVPTFLGAHAVPAEYRDEPGGGAEAYLRSVIDAQLPAVVEQGLARSCDVFCEAGVFSPDQSRRLLLAARERDLAVRLHADELAPSGGAELAAELGALSADHLAAPSTEGVAALARAAAEGRAVVAVLLPATTLFLMKDEGAPARAFVEAGVPVALGTDFNPGTSPTANLPLVLSLAVLRLRLSPSEALAAVTVNAAAALGLGESHGSLEPGKQADLVIWDAPSHELLPYWLGADLVRVVVKRGRVVVDRR